MRQGIFLPPSVISADSLMVFSQSLGAVACINMSMHVCVSKDWYPDHLMDTEVQRALAAVSVAALVAAIALPE